MTDSSVAAVHKKTRLRLFFTAVHLVLYFSFTLNWTGWGSGLASRLGSSEITGSLLMFVLLVLIFISLETLFMVLSRWGRS